MNSKMDPMGRAIADISYAFETEDGIIELPDDMGYYGEHCFQMKYKGTIGEPFDWLYIDADTLRDKARRSGYAAEVVAEGEHYDYLARITKNNRRPDSHSVGKNGW